MRDAADAFLRAFLTLLMLFSECDCSSDVAYFAVIGIAGALLLVAAARIIFLSIQIRKTNELYEKDRVDLTEGDVTEEISYYTINGETEEDWAWLDGPNWKGPPGPLPPWKQPNCKN